MRDLVIGLLSVLGVVVGALLQHMLARSKEREGRLSVLRHQSYADFLKAVANAAARNRTADVATQIADAKARTAVYGSNGVLEKLAAFDETGANLDNDESIRAFVTMAEQMRAESSSGIGRVGHGVLARILFGRSLDIEISALHPHRGRHKGLALVNPK